MPAELWTTMSNKQHRSTIYNLPLVEQMDESLKAIIEEEDQTLYENQQPSTLYQSSFAGTVEPARGDLHGVVVVTHLPHQC